MKQTTFRMFRIIICSIILLSTSINAFAQEKIGLLKAVELALERNLTIKQAQFNEAITEETLKQSKYNRLPDLAANAQGSYNFGRSLDQSSYSFTNERIFTAYGSLSTQVILFQGGQLRNQIIQNKILLEADQTNTAKVKNDLILNVITTYLSVLNNQDLVTAAKQQTDVSRLTLNRSEISFKAGNQTLADLSQAKAQLSTADLNVTDAQNALDQSILTLKQYLEIPPQTVLEVEKPDISKLTIKTIYSAEDVYNAAVSVNPDVRLAELRRDAYLQGIKIAKGGYYPTVAMFATLGSNYSSIYQRAVGTSIVRRPVGIVNNAAADTVFGRVPEPIFVKPSLFGQLGDNFYQQIGINLQIPIFTRFATRTSVRKAKITYQNAELTAQLAKNNLSKIIYQAVWDVQAAEKRYHSATQTYNANKDAYDVILKRFNVGLINSLDLNTSLTNLNKAQFDMIQAQYQLVFRSKVIDYYLGMPITL